MKILMTLLVKFMCSSQIEIFLVLDLLLTSRSSFFFFFFVNSLYILFLIINIFYLPNMSYFILKIYIFKCEFRFFFLLTF